VNNILFIVFELVSIFSPLIMPYDGALEHLFSIQATGFCKTYNQFLGVRACFGVAMGGLYGNIAATALEDIPFEARGIVSGMLQQGYAFGYLLAVVFARGLVNTTSHGWRPLFWFGFVGVSFHSVRF